MEPTHEQPPAFERRCIPADGARPARNRETMLAPRRLASPAPRRLGTLGAPVFVREPSTPTIPDRSRAHKPQHERTAENEPPRTIWPRREPVDERR